MHVHFRMCMPPDRRIFSMTDSETNALDFTGEPAASDRPGAPGEETVGVAAGALALDLEDTTVPDAPRSPKATAAAIPLDKRLTASEAGRQSLIGPRRLEGSEQNTMALHTREAFWIFHGKRWKPDGTVMPIVGGRRFAWSVRSIWILSGNDNPFADWMLIRLDVELANLRERLAGALQRYRARIEALRTVGMNLSVLRSVQPQVVPLEFQSPYGYATAALVHAFDSYVRLIKTLIYTDELSDREGRIAVRGLAGPMRGLFDRPIPWQRLLFREALRAHSRSDFLPQSDESARERVAALTEALGRIPPEILTGSKTPRHTRRRMRLTAEELEALAVAARAIDTEGGAANQGLL
jgi:integrating conjugative element protein (TIGR03761 family)